MQFSRCTNISDAKRKADCMVGFASNAIILKASQEADKDLKETNNRIPTLGEKVMQSKDMKESIDLANIIAHESLKVQIQQAQLENVARQTQAQERLQEQRAADYALSGIYTTFDSSYILR